MAGPIDSFDPYAEWLGISPSERPLHHYRLLGLELFEADGARISAAADERMKSLRQYQTGRRGAHTQKLLNELSAARVCLLSPAHKAGYDQWLRGVLQPTTSAAAQPPTRPNLAEVIPPAWTGAAEPLSPPPALSVAASRDVESHDDPQRAAKATAPGRRLILGLAALILLVAGLGGTGAWLSGRAVLRRRSEAQTSPEELVPAEENSEPMEVVDLQPKPPPAIVLLQEGSGEVHFTPSAAILSGAVSLEIAGTSNALVGWSSVDDRAEWQFNLVKAGFFELEISYAASADTRGKKVSIALDEDVKIYTLRAPDQALGVVRDRHIFEIKQSGDHRLQVTPVGDWVGTSWQLDQLRLLPAMDE